MHQLWLAVFVLRENEYGRGGREAKELSGPAIAIFLPLTFSLSRLYVFLTLYRDDDLKFIHLPSSTKDASTWIEKCSPCIFQMFNIHPIWLLSSLYMSWICPKGKIQTHASL
jgi:hypothetical protein